ncbi:MAG: YcjX family protein [Rhodomicrobium sp.]
MIEVGPYTASQDACPDQLLHFVRFGPPKQPAPEFGRSAVLTHIRLDRALNFLIGDKLA